MAENKKKNEENTPKEAVKDFLGKISDEETIEKGKEILKNQKFEVIFGVIVIIGLIISFFFQTQGGVVVGLMSGLILSREFVTGIGKIVYYYQKQRVFKSFTIIVLVVACLIAAPALVVSVAIGMGIRWLLQPKRHCLHIDPKKCACKKK